MASTSAIVLDDDGGQGVTSQLEAHLDNSKEVKIREPTTKSYTIRKANKNQTHTRRYAPYEAKKPNNVPKFEDDFFLKMNLAQNINMNSGPFHAIIDCQPDYRYCFMQMSYYVNKVYDDLLIRSNPYLTPSSLMAYFMTAIYGHALIADISRIRSTKSDFANEFTQQDERSDYYKVITQMYIPQFMEPLLKSLMPIGEPRRKEIYFVHSLACYLFEHDYGRAYPITLFIHAHNVIATRNTNTPVADALRLFYESSLIEQGGVSVLDVRNVIGAYSASGTFDSIIITAFNTLFNPVTSRQQTNRPTFTPVGIKPYDHPINNEINPYIYLLGADENNVTSVSNFIISMSEIIRDQFSCTKILGEIFNSDPNIDILVHHYSNVPLPTWYSDRASGLDKIITAKEFATRIGFMTARTAPSTTIKLKYPDPTAINPPLYLVNPADSPYDPAHDPDIVRTFDTNRDVNPEVFYFNPYDDVVSTYQLNVVNGLHIENDWFCSFSVPVVNPLISLAENNSQFLNSAIPANFLRTAWSLSQTQPFISLKRTTSLHGCQPFRASFGNMAQNRIPMFDSTVPVEPGTLPSLHGFNQIKHIGSFLRSSNTISLRHDGPSTNAFKSTWNEHLLTAWTSYRYINPDTDRSAARDTRVLFILDFRTFYGTNVTLASSVHPFKLIPKA